MKWVGLTGGIATGKSLVASYIRELGYSVIDADQLAHNALIVGTECYNDIVKLFGNKILNLDQSINRKSLGDIVFTNKVDLNRLENIVHPYVQKKANEERRRLEANGHELAFYDVPLLFEKELQNQFTCTVLVYSPLEIQRERIRLRDKLNKEDIEKRISSQIPIEDKKEKSDFIIYNTSNVADLKKEVKLLIQQLEN
jgi:dephospho-CoA kinase